MQTAEQQILIGFNEFKVTKLEMNISGPNNGNELNVTLGFDPIFFKDENRKKEFALDFLIKLNNLENTLLIEVKALAYFRTSIEITEEFKLSDWPIVNAPAIAFPYLRAFISTVSLNAGINPVILPAFNFTKLNPSLSKENQVE